MNLLSSSQRPSGRCDTSLGFLSAYAATLAASKISGVRLPVAERYEGLRKGSQGVDGGLDSGTARYLAVFAIAESKTSKTGSALS